MARGRARWLFAVLVALAGLVVLGVGVVFASTYCWDICEPGSKGWFARKGAWEPWVQLAAAALVAVLGLVSATLALRGRWRAATTFALAAGAPLIVWVLILIRL